MPPRSFDRRPDQTRPVTLTRGFLRSAHGSVLIEFGHTRVLCTAMVQAGVPPFKVGSGTGWITAEYAMLPGSTPQRKERKPDGRSTEIQRLIGRALRATADFSRLGENTIYIDCDVLQADGGTRTAAITGGYVALCDAIAQAVKGGLLPAGAEIVGGPIGVLSDSVAAVSVGIVGGVPVLDLDYPEDSKADVDMNVAMTGAGRYIEVQGCGEHATFDESELAALLALGRKGCAELRAAQLAAAAGPLPPCMSPPRAPRPKPGS